MPRGEVIYRTPKLLKQMKIYRGATNSLREEGRCGGESCLDKEEEDHLRGKEHQLGGLAWTKEPRDQVPQTKNPEFDPEP